MTSQADTERSPALPTLARIDGQTVNLATRADAIAAMLGAAGAGHGFTLFTLNLDHLVKRRADAAFRAAYARATFVTADGAPVVRLTRAQSPRIQRTTGADLVAPLCRAAAANGVPLYLFGATQSSLDKAALALCAQYPGLAIAGAEAPPFGFDPLSAAADAAAARMAESGARIVLLALGAPKQELFADRAFAQHPGLGFVCIGAALDFISGEQARAPKLFQAIGFEWLWRLGSQPRRLAARYWQCALLLADIAVVAPLRKRWRGADPRLSL